MRTVTLFQPNRLVYGNGCAMEFTEHFATLGWQQVFIVTASAILPVIEPLVDGLKKRQLSVTVYDKVSIEPTVEIFNDALRVATTAKADAVIGIGGGSALDVAKLVAGLKSSEQEIQQVFGIGKLSERKTYLACFPTTSGTGSEVSPNAILLDENDQLKKAVVSPYLVPDAAYIDPLLTLTVPPFVTAATGIDALTHCIEVYANRYAHSITDLYALEGIRLIGANLKLAFENGEDVDARANLALGSLYGGLCLGPVNTAAVHALAYPLGGRFHVAHGVSNALLLPYVMEFNIPEAPGRYAKIAQALGAEQTHSDIETARRGLEKIKQLLRDCRLPTKLSEIRVPKEAIDSLAESTMTVTRLLKNNLREVTLQDAKRIYEEAF
jgi:alcohol dehydrogenase class IV